MIGVMRVCGVRLELISVVVEVYRVTSGCTRVLALWRKGKLEMAGYGLCLDRDLVPVVVKDQVSPTPGR